MKISVFSRLKKIGRGSIAALSFVTLLGGVSACTTYEGVEKLGTVEMLKPTELPPYVIQPGDILDVKFFYSQDLNDNVEVRPDGWISLQLIDDVRAAGMTVQELDDALTELYSYELSDKANVSVIVKEFADQRVYVTGEVARPGEYGLKHKHTILQAITSAGGFLDSGKRDAVLILRQQDNEAPKIYLAELEDSALKNLGENGTYAMLMPRDIIYVPKSNVAKVDLFMDQYVRDILRFNGFSAGVSGVVELNNKDAEGTFSN